MALTSTCSDGFQARLGLSCIIVTFIFNEVKGHLSMFKSHLRSSWKIGTKLGFIDTRWYPLYIHAVKCQIQGQRSSKIRGKVVRWAQNSHLFWKLEVPSSPFPHSFQNFPKQKGWGTFRAPLVMSLSIDLKLKGTIFVLEGHDGQAVSKANILMYQHKLLLLGSTFSKLLDFKYSASATPTYPIRPHNNSPA